MNELFCDTNGKAVLSDMVLDDAWGRCTADHRWKLIARVENVVATFKEENCQ